MNKRVNFSLLAAALIGGGFVAWKNRVKIQQTIESAYQSGIDKLKEKKILPIRTAVHEIYESSQKAS